MPEAVIHLADGRSLAYGVYGNPHGTPVYHLHGTPGSRLEAALIQEYLAREELCLVGFDRPGYGHSSMKRGWQIRDIPQDVVALADHLGHERFIVSGYSGGGPFAIACAHQIPTRLLAVGIISGVGPASIGSQGMHDSNRRKFNLAQQAPWLARWLIRAAFMGLRKNPRRLEKQLLNTRRQMPEPDQTVFQDTRFLDWLLRETMDAIAVSTVGFAHEEILMAFPWQFELREIQHPRLFLWHGCLDRNVPVAMAQAVAEQIPGCRPFFMEMEGHLSLIYRHGKEIFDTLLNPHAE
jgi:pimeloyl-ACP methyl ester carboxylesterase